MHECQPGSPGRLAPARHQALEVRGPVEHQVECVGIGGRAECDRRETLPSRVHVIVLVARRAQIEAAAEELTWSAWPETVVPFEGHGNEAHSSPKVELPAVRRPHGLDAAFERDLCRRTRARERAHPLPSLRRRSLWHGGATRPSSVGESSSWSKAVEFSNAGGRLL